MTSESEKKLKRLQADNRRLRADNDRLRRENSELREDRGKYQEWVSQKFGWFVDLLSKDQTPNMKWLVQDTTKLLQNTQKFYWTSRS